MYKLTHRKPDPLKLLAIGVALAVLMTSAVAAAEPFYKQTSLADVGADLADGQLMLAPVGRQGAAIHMSYTALDGQSAGDEVGSPAVLLSLRVPW